jgi:hypothetical protein
VEGVWVGKRGAGRVCGALVANPQCSIAAWLLLLPSSGRVRQAGRAVSHVRLQWRRPRGASLLLLQVFGPHQGEPQQAQRTTPSVDTSTGARRAAAAPGRAQQLQQR